MLDKTGGSSAPKQGAKAYSYAELASATNNFKSKIGAGGFGPVFWGKLATGQEVAVKVSDVNSRQGAQEFNNEVGFGFLVFSQSSLLHKELWPNHHIQKHVVK